MNSWLKDNGVPILIGIGLAGLIFSMNSSLREDLLSLEARQKEGLLSLEARLREDMLGFEARQKEGLLSLEARLREDMLGFEARQNGQLGGLEEKLDEIRTEDLRGVKERLAAVETLAQSIKEDLNQPQPSFADFYSAEQLPPDFVETVVRVPGFEHLSESRAKYRPAAFSQKPRVFLQAVTLPSVDTRTGHPRASARPHHSSPRWLERWIRTAKPSAELDFRSPQA